MVSQLFTLKSLLCFVVTFACLEGGAELGQLLSFPPRDFATCWPPSGIIVGLLAFAPRRCWPAMLIGAVAGNLFHNWRMNIGFETNVVFTCANFLEVSLGGYLLQRLFGQPFLLNSISRVLTLVLLVGLGCTTLSAFLGATMVNQSGTMTEYWREWFLWWAADVVGVVLFVPITLAVLELPQNIHRFDIKKALEASVLFGLLTLISVVVFFYADPNDSPLRFPFYTFPLLAWAGLSFGRSGGALATIIVGVCGTWATTRGLSVFASHHAPVTSQVLVLQAFLIVTMLTSLLFSVMFESLTTARNELQSTNNLLSAIMEGTSDGAFVKDASGRYLLLNSAGARNFGRTMEEVIGKTDHELLPREMADFVRSRDLKILTSGVVTTTEDTVSFGEQPRTFLTTKGPYRDARGNVIGLAGISADITSLKEAEEKLRRANETLETRVTERTMELTTANLQLVKEMTERSRVELRLREQQAELAHVARVAALGEMAAGLAHELNQPLHAISNYARGVMRRIDSARSTPADLREALAEIVAESDRAAAIIRRVSSFVSKRPYARHPLLIDDLIRNVSTLMTAEANRRHSRLELTLGASSSWVLGDAVQLEQVLVNLVRNGLEAMETTPEPARLLQIESSLVGDKVMVEVRDQGCGVPDGLETKLYDAFFTTKSHGLGMGLAISRSIVEAHEGELSSSPRLPRGTTFRFLIPVHDENQAAENDSDLADDSSSVAPPATPNTTIVSTTN